MTDHDPAQRPPRDFPTTADLPPAGAWLEALGMILDEISGTRVTAHLDLGPQHHTPWGVVHGGIYPPLIESVACVGASAAVFEREEFANRELLALENGGRGADTGDALDEGGVDATMDDAPRGVVLGAEVEMSCHPRATDLIEDHPECFKPGAGRRQVGGGGEVPRWALSRVVVCHRCPLSLTRSVGGPPG